ncbi:MAG: NAD(P)/FAD-dependent oxidoreductase [Acutalibacteraceae bacterium]|nr:NAD(P)/FAD-dependent oxidoreductase [Oscillospiraceae bacterium]
MNVAIIGGGASGLACAVELAGRGCGAKITVFEGNDRVGKKLLATGNGRCNLTNLSAESGGYRNMAFASYALSVFPPESNIGFFNSIGLYTRTDPCGRVYPLSNQASSVLDSLRFAAQNLGVNIITDIRVHNVEKREGKFFINGKGGYDFVVLSTGGKAAPSQGSDGSGYKILRSFGHRITKLSPSLVQLETKNKVCVKQLKGVRCEVNMTLSLDGKVACQKHGELLFTDYGLSGIVSMEISAYASPYINSGGKNAAVSVDLVPSYNEQTLEACLKKQAGIFPEKAAEDILSGFLPKKIGQSVLKSLGISGAEAAGGLPEKTFGKLAAALKSFTFEISGTKDFSFAQVTAGGADTDEFDRKTMQSKKVENLFCAGEILDVDGDCGGFNLNWAWSSGRLAARSIAEKVVRNVKNK